MATNTKKILILGGYGRAGKNIADLLLLHSSHELIIAGKSKTKADKCRGKLAQKHPKKTISSVKIDIKNREDLKANLKSVDLVITCIPLDFQTATNLIDTILQTGNVNYIDLSPGNEKLKAFREKDHLIRQSQQLFILDAGFEPGLPGFMGHYVLSQLHKPTKLEIEGIYRDPNIPKGGIKDILLHDEKALIYKAEKWTKASSMQVKNIKFPFGFGKSLSIPIYSPELKSIPEKYSIQELSYFHAGINNVANMVMMLWQNVLKYFLPMDIGISLFRYAIRNFTKKPHGGTIRAIGYSQNTKIEATLFRENLYEATAIPVVATALFMLEKSTKKGGKYFMGEWVDPKTFAEKLKHLGLKVRLNRS